MLHRRYGGQDFVPQRDAACGEAGPERCQQRPCRQPSRARGFEHEGRRYLVTDTVGFIRDLPHTLVTSFRATLEEVRKAEVLIHVRDASSPMRDEHKAEVEKVLGELDVLEKPRLEVLNKIDLLSDEERAALLAQWRRAIDLSRDWAR